MAANGDEVRQAALREMARRELERRRGQPAGINVDPKTDPLIRAQAIGAESARKAGMTSPPSFGGVFSRSAVSQGIDNLVGLPNLAVTAGARLLAGQPLADRQIEGVDPKLNQPLVNFPKIGERVLPLPTGEQVVAGAGAAAEVPGAMARGEPVAMGERFGAKLMQNARDSIERPGATLAGEVTADIGTLLAGRLSMRQAGARARQTNKGLPVPYRAPLEPGLRRQVDDIAKKIVATQLPRGVRRAAETGMEGAVLAILDEGDPVKSAAFNAGAQAGGSLFLSLTKPLVTSRAGLLSTVALGAVGLQLLKQSTPGGDDHILDTIETSIFKVLPVVALGATAAAAGYGRAPKGLQENLPKLADAITAIPRGAIVSLLNDLATDRESGGVTAKVLERFTQDPEYFGPGAMVKIQRALNSESASLSAEIEGMMQNEEFRRLVEGL